VDLFMGVGEGGALVPVLAAGSTMGGMFRRYGGIICILGWIALLGLTITTQYWALQVRTPIGYFYTGPAGPVYWCVNTHTWDAKFIEVPKAWSRDSLLLPYWSAMHGVPYAVMPWWLLLLGWGLLTVVVRRLLRRRQGLGKAFPVEAPAAD
jgi:hypothetical protein